MWQDLGHPTTALIPFPGLRQVGVMEKDDLQRCIAQGCSAQFQPDGHAACSSHTSCLLPNKTFAPRQCPVCLPNVTTDLQAISLLDQKSMAYILLKHCWTAVRKMLSHCHILARWADFKLHHQLGFRNAKPWRMLWLDPPW